MIQFLGFHNHYKTIHNLKIIFKHSIQNKIVIFYIKIVKILRI